MKLLDTSILVDLDRYGGNIVDKIERLDKGGKHAISAVSTTEFFFGLHKRYRGKISHKNILIESEKFLSRFVEIPLKKPISVKAAEIWYQLISQGKIIDLNDIYIAATAIVSGLPLLTKNVKHFERIKDLIVEDWDKL